MIRALLALTPALAPVLALAAAPASAETLVERIDACVTEIGAYGDHVEQCLGLHAQPCMEEEENFTTVGMVNCLVTEAEAWETILSREVRRLLPRLDEEQKAALLETQAAWSVFRDADCAFPYVLVRGTLAQPWSADCLMQHTARRAMEMRGLVAYTEN